VSGRSHEVGADRLPDYVPSPVLGRLHNAPFQGSYDWVVNCERRRIDILDNGGRAIAVLQLADWGADLLDLPADVSAYPVPEDLSQPLRRHLEGHATGAHPVHTGDQAREWLLQEVDNVEAAVEPRSAVPSGKTPPRPIRAQGASGEPDR
jgi:hypothetical protein